MKGQMLDEKKKPSSGYCGFQISNFWSKSLHVCHLGFYGCYYVEEFKDYYTQMLPDWVEENVWTDSNWAKFKSHLKSEPE